MYGAAGPSVVRGVVGDKGYSSGKIRTIERQHGTDHHPAEAQRASKAPLTAPSTVPENGWA